MFCCVQLTTVAGFTVILQSLINDNFTFFRISSWQQDKTQVGDTEEQRRQRDDSSPAVVSVTCLVILHLSRVCDIQMLQLSVWQSLSVCDSQCPSRHMSVTTMWQQCSSCHVQFPFVTYLWQLMSWLSCLWQLTFQSSSIYNSYSWKFYTGNVSQNRICQI